MTDQILIIAGAIVVGSVLVAIILVHWGAPGGTNAIRHLTNTLADLSKMVRALEADNAIQRGKIARLEEREENISRLLRELRTGISELYRQIESMGGVPIWDIPESLMRQLDRLIADRDMPEKPAFTQTYQLLGEFFNLDEIRELCVELGIRYEDLIGQTRQMKAMSLMDYVYRHHRVDDLVQLAKKKRPSVDWPDN